MVVGRHRSMAASDVKHMWRSLTVKVSASLARYATETHPGAYSPSSTVVVFAALRMISTIGDPDISRMSALKTGIEIFHSVVLSVYLSPTSVARP